MNKMLNDKFMITLLGLVVAVFAICKINTGSVTSNEGFLGNLPSMQTKVWRSVGNQKGDLYSIPGQYQAMLSPRMNASIDYGANIRYNVPSYKNMAVPCDPLAMGDMVSENYSRNKETYCGRSCSSDGFNKQNAPYPSVRENFCGGGGCKGGGGCGSPVCGKGGANLPNNVGYNPQVHDSGYAAGNYNETIDDLYTRFPAEAQSMLPVGDMTTVNALGEVIQPIVYDRFVYANRNSRLRGQGDPIRGDLPIVPCGGDWFRPSVHPQIDLQEGAMNVMGGIYNETSNSLSELITMASAGTDTTLGGVNISNTNLSNQFSSSLSGGLGDIRVSAFP